MSADQKEIIRREYETASMWFKQMEASPAGSMLDEQKAEVRVRFNQAYKAFIAAGSPSKPAPPAKVPAVTLALAQMPADRYATLVDRSAQGNANLLIGLAQGNLRYVAETKQWLRWTDKRWHVDTHETFVTTHALEVAKFYLEQARAAQASGGWQGDSHGNVELAEDLFKWATKCRSKGAIDDTIALARKVPGVPISVTELDRNPWLLGVDNGVVDLRTGELREQESREDYVTKRCPIRYVPNATAPRWEALIEQATGSPLAVERDSEGDVIPATVGRYEPRPALARYLWKALGYAITGTTREHKFFFAIGEGSNGKGLIFDTVKAILGPYAVTIPASLFMLSKYDADAERPTSFAATLAGARLAVASEVREGQRLNAAAIKSHTGDAEQTVRRMRENPFTFTQSHKVFLLTNVEPVLDHIDSAMRGRLHLAPFDRRWNRPGEVEKDPALPDGDKELAAHLQTAYEGVLAWLVRAAIAYQAEGLTPPAEVTNTTRDYIKGQDTLGRWIATMQRCKAAFGTLASQLFGQFTQWCGSEGAAIEPANQNAFSRALRKTGIESHLKTDGTYWGLRGEVSPPGALPPLPPPPPGALPPPPPPPPKPHY